MPVSKTLNANSAAKRRLEMDGMVLRLRCSVAERDAAKSIPDGRWNPFDRAWEYPRRPEIIDQIISKFPGISLPESLQPAKPVQEPIEVTPNVKLPIKATPFKHQIDAYNFACKCLGVV